MFKIQVDLLEEIKYKIILVMFSLMCLFQIVRIVVFFTLERRPPCFLQSSQMDKLNLLSCYDDWRFHRFSFMLGRGGEVRGVQLQHATSPLGASKFYTHWTFKFKKQQVYIWWLIFWFLCMVPLTDVYEQTGCHADVYEQTGCHADVYEQTGCPAVKGLFTDWCHTSVISLKVL